MLEILSGASPVSLATMAIASSAEARCCASKSGGTYSASITGVVGKTLIRRIVPFDSFAIIRAVAMAGLASSTSARSIGTRMRLYMAGPLWLSEYFVFCHGVEPRDTRTVGNQAGPANHIGLLRGQGNVSIT